MPAYGRTGGGGGAAYGGAGGGVKQHVEGQEAEGRAGVQHPTHKILVVRNVSNSRRTSSIVTGISLSSTLTSLGQDYDMF